MLKVITIGGGGGHSAVVQALKDLPVELTALCNTVDNGGGSGRLMQEYGVHSLGDFRRILVALSAKNAEALNYRFSSGPYEGQTISNLLLAGLELSTGSLQAGVDTLRDWLGISSMIGPMTDDTPVLHARTKGSQEIIGQASIVKQVWSLSDPIETVWLEPSGILLSQAARQALIEADYIIITMGDLYSSIAPFFCLKEIQNLWKDLSAKVIWLPNVAVTPGHEHYRSLSRALEFLQSLTPLFIPDVIIAHAGELPRNIQERLQAKGYGISELDMQSNKTTQVIKEFLVEDTLPQESTGDRVERSPIQYSQEKLKNIFKKILV